MKTNKVLLTLVIILSLIIIAGVVYIGYNNFFRQENENIEENGKVNEGENNEENISNTVKELDINSGFVQDLYMYVEDDNRCFNTTFEAREFELDASNIPYETKFIMALQIMLDSDKDRIDCNKYEPTKYFGDRDLSFSVSCGNGIGLEANYYDSVTNTFINTQGTAPYATLLKEENMKARMNQIFGSDTYHQVDLIEYASIWYKYLPEERGYIMLSVPAGGTCIGHLNELTSAVKNDNEVVLTVKKTTGENGDIFYNYEYTFTLNESDYSYYLTHISSKLV